LSFKVSRTIAAATDYRKSLVWGYLGLMLFISGISCVVILSFDSVFEYLHKSMPEFLLRAGTSEYHINRYYSENGFVRAYRLVLLLSCVLSVAGVALSFWRRTISRGSSLLASRIKHLLAIHVFRTDSTLLGVLDRYAGSTLLGIATIILVFSMFTMPIRSDEALMYTSVASSVLPLWSVAYIAPNNHVGYAALVWVGHFIWGDAVPGMPIFGLFAWVLSIVILHQILVELLGMVLFLSFLLP
jgi:hypothetical protein